MSEIVLEQVTKTYPNGFTAVKGVDMTIPDGQFMVLVGPSGCGKTTLLRMIAGLERTTDGTVRIGERIVNDLGPRDRDIAMVFQNYALYPHMTVAQNAGFALKLARLPKEQIADRVRGAADILGLGQWLERKPGELSGGQRQRVAMGRAIVREPSAFLMDEPLSNLDAKLRVQMRAEISRIQRRLDVATVYVTHDQVEAMTMGDRVAVMRDGVVLQVDEPQVVYDHPVDMFVGSFIGSPAMNLYEASVEDGGGALRLGSQHVSLAELGRAGRSALAALAGQTVIAGLRPEHLTPVSDGDTATALVGEVELVEALGSELLVHFTLDATRVRAEGDPDEVEEQLVAGGLGVARVDPRTRLRPGERVRFAADVTRMHFFEPECGRSILDPSDRAAMAVAGTSPADIGGPV